MSTTIRFRPQPKRWSRSDAVFTIGDPLPHKPGQKPKILISAGTYDCVHDYHIFTTICACNQFEIDQVHVIPNGQSPYKPNATDPEIRFEFLHAAYKPLSPQFKVTRLEIDMLDANGQPFEKSWTINTIRAYREAYGDSIELYYAIGLDNLEPILKWKDSPEIFEHTILLVAPRDLKNADPQLIKTVLPAGARFGVIRCPSSSMSSSDIRNMRKSGESVRGFMPDSVWLGLRYYGLYRDSSAEAGTPVLGPASLSRSENWALAYYQLDPVTHKQRRFPRLTRLLHWLGYYGFGSEPKPLTHKVEVVHIT